MNYPQHSISKSIFLHLFPGICILLAYMVLGPWCLKNGFSPSIAILIGFLFIGIPIQIFILLREGKRLSGKFTLNKVLYYTQTLPWWQYVIILILFIVYAGVLVFLYTPLSEFLVDKVSIVTPDWFIVDSQFILQDASGNIVLISFLLLFLVDGIVNPIVEEIYFRGYLMPRISRFNTLTPILGGALFAIAHFWQPWNIILIFILVTPLYFLVWKKKSFFITIFTHCAANLAGATANLAAYLSSVQ